MLSGFNSNELTFIHTSFKDIDKREYDNNKSAIGKVIIADSFNINTDFIKSNCYDEINEEVDAYNVTEAETVYVKAIVNGVPFL